LVLSTILEDEDGSNDPLIWEMYYHLFLSTPAFRLLQSQAEKLLRATESIDEWHNSANGSRIRFMSQDTLSQLRYYWLRYSTDAIPEKSAVLNAMRDMRSARSHRYVLTSIRSAGPLFMHAVGVSPELHRHYWENGVVWGDAIGAVYTNPTMLNTEVRGTKFAVHYGTEPVLPFHLAPAFVELSSSDPLYNPSLGEAYDSREHAARIANCAKSQFRLWSSSFRKRPRQTYVRFVICDALNLCSSLARQEETGITSNYTRQWTLAPLALDGGDYNDKRRGDSSAGPTSFNVIDTSNLIDHVGLLNLLAAVVPCLQKRPSATLFTESLLSREDEADQVESFTSLLLTNQTAIFVLFGMCPLSYLTGTSMQSSAMDSARGLLGSADPTKGQVQRRVGWKIPHLEQNSDTLLQMDAESLARVLLNIYLKMFSVEGLGVLEDTTISRLSKLSVVHYTRSSFAELVLFFSTKVNADWNATFDLLLDHIAKDYSLIVGPSSIQDLYIHFYLRGLYTAPSLVSAPREMSHSLPPLQNSGPGVLANHLVGPVVSVNLIVPRAALDVLTNVDPTIIGTPALRAEINGHGWQNFFSTIQMSFGIVVAWAATTINFQEDPLGWRGRSDMIVSFLAPSWMLLLDSAKSIKISLDIQSTPGSAHLASVIGIQLRIYEAVLCDQEHVFVTAQPPMLTSLSISRDPKKTKANFPPLRTLANDVTISGPEIIFQRDHKAIDTMKIRLDIVSESLKAKLSRKSTAVKPIQTDPCSITLKYGGHEDQLKFFFPVNVVECTVRIARKLSYIEVRWKVKYSKYNITNTFAKVLVPPWVPSHEGGYTSNPFPVFLSEEEPILLNVHNLHLEGLPELMAGRRMEWLETHAAMTLSARERRIRHPTVTSSDGLLNLKENLHALFATLSTPSNPADQIYALRHPSKGGIYALIFASTVRLDLSAQTVVADSHVLPITSPLPKTISQFLRNPPTRIRNLPVSDEGMRLWSSFLAVSVERCRSDIWEHVSSKCRYRASGRFPVSSTPVASPLCGCGTGKVSEAFKNNKAYARLAPYVDRAAIGLVFTVPFYEQIFTGM
jgi:hypothetical protein